MADKTKTTTAKRAKKAKAVTKAAERRDRKEKVVALLKRSRGEMSYGDLAEKVGTGAMACGQILKSIAADGPAFRKLTSKVKSKKQLAA